MSIKQSILALCKNNNGFFKSARQAEFLTSKLEKVDGLVGTLTAWGNSSLMFAEWDSKGIVKIVKLGKSDSVFFERMTSEEWEAKQARKSECANVQQASVSKAIESLKSELAQLEANLAAKKADPAMMALPADTQAIVFAMDLKEIEELKQRIENF